MSQNPTSSSGQNRFLSLLTWQCSKIRTAWMKDQAGRHRVSFNSNRFLRKYVIFITGGCWEQDKQTFIYRKELVNKKMVIFLFSFTILCDSLDWIFYSMRPLGLLQEEREVRCMHKNVFVNLWSIDDKTCTEALWYVISSFALMPISEFIVFSNSLDSKR